MNGLKVKDSALETKLETIPQIIRDNSVKWSGRTAMCMKRFGIWQRYTWKQYYDQVKYFSLGLVSLGMERGDVVGIIGIMSRNGSGESSPSRRLAVFPRAFSWTVFLPK